ncbi:MAG: malonate transporter subunit MadM, partial [Smithella sp.]
MMEFVGIFEKILVKNSLVTAFALVGIVTFVSYALSKYFTKGKLNGSSIAILFGLLMAYVGCRMTEGSKGISDIPVFAGIGVLGGSMMRDFTIVATAFGADFNELRRSGLAGIVSLVLGVLFSFTIGAIFAWFGGYTSAE